MMNTSVFIGHLRKLQTEIDEWKSITELILVLVDSGSFDISKQSYGHVFLC